MIKIDNTTYILKDGSILNFYDDGLVKMYPSKEWKQPRKSKKTKHNKTHEEYKYANKEQAILVWNNIEKQLEK